LNIAIQEEKRVAGPNENLHQRGREGPKGGKEHVVIWMPVE
jgi:hypothetical protein